MIISINPMRLFCVLCISSFFACALSLVELPEWLFYFRPDWLALVVVYWVLALPKHVSIGYGFLNGLFLDLMLVKPLGLNAIGFVLLAFFISRWFSQIRALPIWQQCLLLAFLISICKLLIGVAALITTEFVFTHYYWFSILGNVVFWPIVYVLLRHIRRTFLMLES
jgi:rod shape-determining protein MreD